MFQKNVKSKSKDRFTKNLMVHLFGLFVVFCIVSGTPSAMANDAGNEIPFAEAELYFELNNTDGDLGIHSLIDGDPWRRLTIKDSINRKMLNIYVQGRLRKQGLTEIFFESAEPTFDELSPTKFFHRFPEGFYEIKGKTLEGQKMKSTAFLTHYLPAPPANITLNGVPVAEDCDAEPLPGVQGPVNISWDAVDLSHPELGITDVPIEVVQYEVVVEDEERGLIFSVEVSPEVTSVELPVGFTSQGGEFKLEILVREVTHNQTAVETCFVVDHHDED